MRNQIIEFLERARPMFSPRVGKMRSYICRILFVMCALNIGLPLAAQSAASPQRVGEPSTSHALRISSGDLLELNVFDTPELSGRVRVSEAGEIVVPVAGAVRVSGMTAEEAAVAIEEKLRSKDVMKYPHVSIFISEYATQGVTVTGEVRNPGIYPLLGNHGLLDLVSAAGGVTTTAGKAITVIHRSNPEHPEVVLINNRPGSVAPNIDIRPGDMIAVSRAGVAYVVGAVGKPGGFLIETNDRLTALQVLALAGGTTASASQDKARLIRKTATSRLELPVPLKKILSGKVIDMPLEDGDILFVPSSERKNLAYRGMEAAIAVTTGLIIYRGL